MLLTFSIICIKTKQFAHLPCNLPVNNFNLEWSSFEKNKAVQHNQGLNMAVCEKGQLSNHLAIPYEWSLNTRPTAFCFLMIQIFIN